jgi:hypothetical protein
VELFLPKSVRFSRYGRLQVFGLHGHFGPIAIFFGDLDMTYPPILKCSKQDGAKTFS